MKNILAENMLRFGVKNLPEHLQKTFLNEGLQAGAEVSSLGSKGDKFDLSTVPASVAQKANSFTNMSGIYCGGNSN